MWRRPDAVRSIQGTHAVAAIGPDAEWYCRDHIEAGIWGAKSPIGKFIERDGWVLCIGTTVAAATAYHVAEMSVPCRCMDMFGGKDRVVIDGQVREVPGLVWRSAGCPVPPKRLIRALARKSRRGKIGKADSTLVTARDVWQMRRKNLKNLCPSCRVRPDAHWKKGLLP